VEDMTTVEHAARCLLTVCDGAITKDHCGYNGSDAPFARSVLSHDNLSYKQERALHKILLKYKGQLLSMGVDYDSIEFTKSETKTKSETMKVVPGSDKVEIWFGKHKGLSLIHI